MPIPDNYKADIQPSAKTRAFEQIQEWIIDGTLLPGEKINDVELAKAINISRTPVREALQLLNQQGFVTMKPGVATYVNETNPKDIEKLLPPLSALQSVAAELAAAMIDQDSINKLRNINADFEQAIKNESFYDALKYDEQFHKVIVDTSENEYIANAVSMMQAHVRRLFFQRAIALSLSSVKEHEQIICAFEKKDSEKAAKLAKDNWLRPVKEDFNKRNILKEGE